MKKILNRYIKICVGIGINFTSFLCFFGTCTLKNGTRSGAKSLYHWMFIYFWEHVCATISYMKFSWAKVNGLEWIPQMFASSSIKSIACFGSSWYILSIMLMHRSSNNLHNTLFKKIKNSFFWNCEYFPISKKCIVRFMHYIKIFYIQLNWAWW